MLRSEIGARALAVHGDCLRLTQAIGNVLSNAAKYTERGGRITLSAQERDAQAEIIVRDNGIGIAPDSARRGSSICLRSLRRRSEGQTGLGIGLALVRRLVEMHGGTVSASSDGDGLGQ